MKEIRRTFGRREEKRERRSEKLKAKGGRSEIRRKDLEKKESCKSLVGHRMM